MNFFKELSEFILFSLSNNGSDEYYRYIIRNFPTKIRKLLLLF